MPNGDKPTLGPTGRKIIPGVTPIPGSKAYQRQEQKVQQTQLKTQPTAIEPAEPISIEPTKYEQPTLSDLYRWEKQRLALYNVWGRQVELDSDIDADIAGIGEDTGWETARRAAGYMLGPGTATSQLLADIGAARDERAQMQAALNLKQETAKVHDYTSWKWYIREQFRTYAKAKAENPDFDGTIDGVTFIDIVNESAVPAYIDDLPGRREAEEEEISKMISALGYDTDGIVSEYMNDEYRRAESDGTLVPALVAPTGPEPRPMQALYSMTISEIVRALNRMEKAPTITPDEWESLFSAPPELDEELYLTASERAEELKQINDYRKTLFTAGFDMPEYSTLDWFKFAAVQPMQAAMDGMEIYFKKVSMPIASFALMSLPWVAGGLEDEYNEARAAGLDPWSAAGEAWDNWDINWGYKAVMETPFDPLTYLGWGLVARLPGVGAKGIRGLNYIGKADLAFKEGFDWFADSMKVALAKIPKTAFQRSLLVEMQTGAEARQYLERYSGKFIGNISTSPITRVTPSGREVVTSEWKDLIDTAIKAASRPLYTDTDAARFGQRLLAYAPIEPEDIVRWSEKAGGTVTLENMSPELIRNVNELFQSVLYRKVGQSNAARELLFLLGADITPDSVKLASRNLLGAKKQGIMNLARSFGDTDNINQSLRKLMKRNGSIDMKWSTYKTHIERIHVGGYNKLLYDMEPRLYQIWNKYVEKMWVRPFAEAYLTFGLYGPMNVIEDYLRSTLGGVMPARMNTPEFQQLMWGLKYDQNLNATGFVEMWGPTRSALDEPTHSNWVLDLMMSPLSIPTYVATKGKVTPRQFGSKMYEVLVRMPGGVGAEVRRNFTAKKYIQLLRKSAPDRYDKLTKLADRTTPDILPDNVRKMLSDMARTRMLSLQPDQIRGLASELTRRQISKAELQNILKAYPDLPQVARDLVYRRWYDGTLFDSVPKSAPEWDEGYRVLRGLEDELNSAILDDFIRSPAVAAEQFNILAHELDNIDISSIQDLAWLMQQLHTIGHAYGAVPEQVLKQATIRSRGLKFDMRRADIEDATDRIFNFLDSAGVSLDTIRAKLDRSVKSLLDSGKITDRALYDRYIDSFLAEIKYSSDFRVSSLSWRQEFFASAKSTDLKKSWFWEDFYRQLDEKFEVFDSNMLRMKSNRVKLAQAVDKSHGNIVSRKPVVVKDRPLTPQDIADIFGVEVDNISNALMGVLVAENNKRHFISYVLSHTIDGDVGFTEKSIGDAYDMIVASLRVDPANMSWITQKQQEIKGLMQDVYSLYNSRQMDEAQEAALKQYLDDLAFDLEDILYGAIPPEDIASSVNKFLAYRGEISESGLHQWGWVKDNIKEAEVTFTTRTTDIEDVRNEFSRAMSGFRSKGIKDVETNEYKYTPSFFKGGDIKGPVKRVSPAKKLEAVLGKDDALALAEYAAKITSSGKVESVYLVGSVASGKKAPGDIDILYDIGKVDLPTDSASASTYIESVIESIDSFDLESFDTFIKAGDRYFHLSHGAGREVVENTDYALAQLSKNKIPLSNKGAVDFSDWNDLRQAAIDEAERWYYKEFTDYTNGNAFDATMKAIYPYWTYESQRWLWAPRSFMRRPITFTTVNRYNMNTDYGNIDIPGLPIDINIFRGTIYGPFTSSLMRGNFPEYYDNLPPGFSHMVAVNDTLNHYGFYPGAHISAPLAWFGGASHQTGEMLPAGMRTGMSILMTAFPDSPHVQFLSEKIFPDRFRNYFIAKEVNSRGMDGYLIRTKIEEGRDLTEEEEQVWSEATRYVSGWNILMEQTAMFRFRPEEEERVRREARLAVEEITGITVAQQEYLHRHGFKLWDIIGGMDLSDQVALEELDYYSGWAGTYKTLLPSRQAAEERRLALDWDEVERHSESTKQSVADLKSRFLDGQMGPAQYLSLRAEEYSRLREFVTLKMEENPLMTLEGRMEYNQKYGKDPIIRHPSQELKTLWYDIELEVGMNEDGIYGPKWEEFWEKRAAVDAAIPEEYRAEWDEFLSRNMDELDKLHQQVYRNYFDKYYAVEDAVLSHYSQDEQYLIKEYLRLEDLGQEASTRANEIKDYISSAGNKLISQFSSEVSTNREALRRSNPYLDAWLIYWGKTTSPKSPETLTILDRLYEETGRRKVN